jgi:hypothetical protein
MAPRLGLIEKIRIPIIKSKMPLIAMAKSNPGRRPGLDFTPSIPVVAKNLINLCHRELVELHDLGLSAESGRQNEPGFILAVHFRNDPGFMIAVLASPIRVCYEMGAGL